MVERCACCGGGVGRFPVELRYRGRQTVFCSFGCAVVQAAPACFGCGAKVLGKGIEAAGKVYCSASCAHVEAAAR